MMSSEYEDSVLGFDLDLLSQNATAERNNCSDETQTRLEKQKKFINILKKRVISSDLLVKKFIDTKEALDITNKELSSTRDDCKKIYADYQISLDTCTRLENEIAVVKATNKQIEQKCFHTTTQFEALKSHSHQLQMLVKQHESEIDVLRAGRQINKCESKDFDKKLMSFEKRNNTLVKHVRRFCKIILGKRKLTNKDKKILKQYEKSGLSKANESSLTEDSDNESDNNMFQDCMSPFSLDDSLQDDDDMVKINPATLELDNHPESIDTGRGSSLAYSNNNSPDYFISTSPLSTETIKTKVKVVSTATSPIHIENVQLDTSPLPIIIVTSDKCVTTESSSNISKSVSTSPIRISRKEVATSPSRIASKEVGTSPPRINVKEVSTSSPKIAARDVATSSPIIATKKVGTSPKRACNNHDQQTQVKECLEINNSNHNLKDNTDSEIERILTVMKLGHSLITPIPKSPALPLVESANVTDSCAWQSRNGMDTACQGAISVREENTRLMHIIENLTKDVHIIKRSLLKNHIEIESNKDVSSPDCLDDNVPPYEDCSRVVVDSIEIERSDTEEDLIIYNDNLSTEHLETSRYMPEQPNVHKTTSICSQSPEMEQLANPSLVSKVEKSSLPRKLLHYKSKCLESKENTESANSKVSNQDHNTCESVKLPKNMQVLFDSSGTESGEDEDENHHNSMDIQSNVSPKVCKIKRNNKNVSKLDKLRKTLKPKSKIKRASPPLVNSRKMKAKVKNSPAIDQKSIHTIPDETVKNQIINGTKSQVERTVLNNKDAYEKAVKIMAELKRKAHSENHTSIKTPKGKVVNDVTSHKSPGDQSDEEILSKVIGSKSTIENNCKDQQKHKQPVTRLLRSNFDNKSPKPQKRKSQIMLDSIVNSPNQKDNTISERRISVDTVKSSNILSECSFGSTTLDKINTRGNKLEENFNEIVDKPITLRKQKSGDSLPNNKNSIDQCKSDEQSNIFSEVVTNDFEINPSSETSTSQNDENTADTETKNDFIFASPPRKRSRRSSNDSDVQCTRILRSATLQKRLSTDNNVKDNETCVNNASMLSSPTSMSEQSSPKCQKTQQRGCQLQYDDLDMFSDNKETTEECKTSESQYSDSTLDPKDSILCTMICKYGVQTIKTYNRKVSDAAVQTISEKIEQEISKIVELSSTEIRSAMDNFISDLQIFDYKTFVTGLLKYLGKPERKVELFAKSSTPPAPAMTKAEQVLLYVIAQLRTNWTPVDIVNSVLENIEYTLFKLNRTPEFDVIETMSHFYAVVCRYFRLKSRLRLFILDAMYCIQFKSVPLIRQCLDVWTHVLPLAHMGIAKCPLVTSLVYLLHFYKCEDRFNRVQDLRNILNRRYFYKITEWNDTKIIEMLRNSIKELKDIPIEKKMLRLALIILSKRQGPRWCQNNIIKNLLQPFIENDSGRVREFCVSMIGPLMKPFPLDMKVYCEIAIDQLTNIIKEDSCPRVKEASFASLMLMSRHNQHSINRLLFSTKMTPMSAEQELILREYVRTKPLKMWKRIIFRLARNCDDEVK